MRKFTSLLLLGFAIGSFAQTPGRAVQVKKDGVVTSASKGNSAKDENVMIVSGRNVYDAFGRVAKAFYPTTEGTGSKSTFSKSFDNVSPTVTVYDVLDRATSVILPDNSTTTTAYTVDNGSHALVTTVTDALHNVQATHTNGSGKTVKSIQHSGPDGEITTTFEYDGIQRLVRVTDTEGNVTTSVYDMGDRRTEVSHPASGITSFTYDPLGNVLTKQTANMAEEGKMITYTYDYHRLTGISYPDHPENNVKYYYGGRNASHNRIGRLMMREDGTGAIEYFYGKMGEVTKTRRTLIVPNQAIATYVTQWTYDSHNRLLEMIYPDEEKVTYSYNLGGLLEKVRGEKSYGYDYITKLGYDKFEQRSYLKYCNGAETFYTYDDRRRLSNLAVNSGNKTIMDNDYTFDAVSNVLSVANNASLPASGNAGGRMSHAYTYDGLYRLVSATGTYTGADSKSASYTLAMGYDNMHRIKSKSQHLTQDNVQFNGTLNVGYDLSYTYGTEAGKKFQLASVKDVNYRTEETPGDNNIENNHVYLYDKNGNLVYVNTGRMMKDGHNEVGTRERKLIWDEENRLLAVDDNGFVSNYWYDADGERTVKTSGESDQVYVNGVFSGGSTNTAKFSLYVSPYLVANQGGRYTKHIYAGSQRIVSKVGDFASYGSDPRRIEYAGANTDGLSVNYKAKYAAQQQVIKDNYKTFDVPYNGTDNDNYADGEGFCCNDGSMEAAVAQARKAQAHAVAKSFKDPDNYENLQFFYHPDHLGSSSFITNLEGEVVQHIEYVPFGEVFIEERNSVWNTPYLFNAKEFDEETGMYYYGARYYEPRLSLWMSTDPMEEKYPDYSTYIYAAQNPIAYSDPTGMEIRGVTKSDAEEFKSDVHLILGDSKFDNLRSLISLKGKKFQQIPDAALADALDGVTCSEDEMAYISLLVNTINSKEVHSIEYLKDGEEVSSSGYSDINKYLNSIDPDSKIGDAFRKREERSDGSTRYYYDDATIQTLGGEGFNVPTSKGSHSFIRGVQDKLKAVTSAHELLGHGLPSARKESPVHNNTNAIRTDNLVRRLLRLPQRDGSDHAGGKDIVSPYSLPYTK
jgi:RHS repeat-associated protein